MVDEEPRWETEIVDELFDMILREGDKWKAPWIQDFRENAENLERGLVFGKRLRTHTNRERKFGELPCPFDA
jgi:hypothetical protein